MTTDGRRRELRLPRLLAVLALLLTTAVAVRPGVAAADAAGLGGDYVAIPKGVDLLDTRDGTGGHTGVVGAGAVVSFPVLGVGGIPASGVSAVMVRLVTTSGTGSSWLRVYPDGTTPNGVSHLNISGTEQVSNTAVVRPGANGKIAVRNNSGSVHIVVTAQAYFLSTPGGGGGFVPVAQNKIVDTRDGLGTTKAKIAAKGTRTITLTGGVIPAGAKAVLADVVAVNVTAAGWLGVVPTGTAGPNLSALNFVPTGHHSHALSLPLSASGQVTFLNQSSAAIDLVIAPYGYITASTGEGAGYRYVPTTRVYDSGSALAAGATVDVQVVGKLGMPTRGVAAAIVNVTVASPSAAGAVKVWPSGTTEPNISQVHNRAGKTVASLAIVKPGANGSIRIKNNAGTARIVVDIQGYFGDPIPSAPIEPYAATVGLQAGPVAGAALGMVEYAYTDNIGRVLIGQQTDVDNFGSVQWTVVSGSEAFAGRPSLGLLSDGRAQVAVQYSDSDVWSRTQSALGSATWNGWADFGGSMAAAPALTRLPNNVMAVFAVDTDGALWVYQQTGTIPAWKALGKQSLVGTPTVVATRTGVRLFVRTATGAVKTAEYSGDVLSAWVDLGGTGTTKPAAVVYPGYRIRLFAQQADGTTATKYQDTAGVFPEAWTTVGGSPVAGPPSAILDPVLGRTAVVARDSAGNVLVSWETLQGSGEFAAWSAAIPDLFEQAATDPTIVPLTNTTGQTWAILFRNINNATRVYQRASASGLSSPAARSAGSVEFTVHTLPAPPA